MQSSGVVLELATTFVPIHARHHDIEKNQVRLPVTCDRQSLETVSRRSDLIIFSRELRLKQARVGRHIVHDKNTSGHPMPELAPAFVRPTSRLDRGGF